MRGTVGDDLTVEQGYQAARLAGLFHCGGTTPHTSRNGL